MGGSSLPLGQGTISDLSVTVLLAPMQWTINKYFEWVNRNYFGRTTTKVQVFCKICFLQEVILPPEQFAWSPICSSVRWMLDVSLDAFAILKITAQLLKHWLLLKILRIANEFCHLPWCSMDDMAGYWQPSRGKEFIIACPCALAFFSWQTNTCSGKLLSHQQFSQVSGKT